MTARRILLVTAAVAVGSVSAGPPARSGDDDAKLLQGKWRVVSAMRNGGSALPKDRVERMFAVIDKDEIRVFVEGTKSEQGAKFTIDSKQDPKQIDFTEVTRDSEWASQLNLKLFRRYKWLAGGQLAPADGKAEGIYKLDGDSLTVCWRTTEARDLIGGSRQVSEPRVRPGVFQSDLYYHQFLFVLERVKPGK